MYKRQGKNTFSVYPKEEEASHLAGIIGGNLTKTGILGIIAGYPNEAMEDVYKRQEYLSSLLIQLLGKELKYSVENPGYH